MSINPSTHMLPARCLLPTTLPDTLIRVLLAGNKVFCTDHGNQGCSVLLPRVTSGSPQPPSTPPPGPCPHPVDYQDEDGVLRQHETCREHTHIADRIGVSAAHETFGSSHRRYGRVPHWHKGGTTTTARKCR